MKSAINSEVRVVQPVEAITWLEALDQVPFDAGRIAFHVDQIQSGTIDLDRDKIVFKDGVIVAGRHVAKAIWEAQQPARVQVIGTSGINTDASTHPD